MNGSRRGFFAKLAALLAVAPAIAKAAPAKVGGWEHVGLVPGEEITIRASWGTPWSMDALANAYPVGSPLVTLGSAIPTDVGFPDSWIWELATAGKVTFSTEPAAWSGAPAHAHIAYVSHNIWIRVK